MHWLKSRLLGLIAFAQRHPGLLALFGFLSGLASFLLVERSEALAQLIALMMLASWILLVLEQSLRASVLTRFGLDLPPMLLRFVTQMVHQESFFFVLPFFFAATYWSGPQGAVTAVLAMCALVCLVDPLYFHALAPRRALFLAFHALALFVTLLVSLPIIIQLDTTQTFVAALGVALLLSLPGLFHLFPEPSLWRVPAMALLLTALAVAIWHIRSWIPAVPLRLAEVSVTDRIDRERREPGPALNIVTSNTLAQDGLYAWTAIRVPRGLRETVYHVWLLNGHEVDRIPMTVSGGRDEGYRAWSHKLHFPPHPYGDWQVRVVTGTGQIIGVVRFTLVPGTAFNNEQLDPQAD